MKKLSTYLFLILFSFQTSSLGSDISDVQIEGISIGDSLLDYFSEEKINANRPVYFEEPEFVPVLIYSQNFKVYDEVQFFIKGRDRKYKIYSITAFIDYDTYIYNCHKKVNELDKELSAILNDAKRGRDTSKHPADKSGKSIIKQISYDLKSGGGAIIGCINWSSKMDYPDYLFITLDSKELFRPPTCYSAWCY